MTKVYCGFKECKYMSQWIDTLGVCTKDEIILDDSVYDIMYGCPDAEWNEDEDIDD